FVRAQSESTRAHFARLPWPEHEQAHFEQLTQDSVEAQRKIEESETVPFEAYREQYVSAERLGLGRRAAAVSL
ncbi:MAG: glutamate--cysteine ligase, partial [Proteobacteria bacterium]|nr:glutamate--cysteine ligase [Pseudomonadota bacterium]